jgi:hypothetical protein
MGGACQYRRRAGDMRRIWMRKLLLASVAMLGGTMALVSVASAQTQVFTGVTAASPPFPNIAAPGTAPYTGAAYMSSPGFGGTANPGFGAPLAPGQMTVRLIGRMYFYAGVASDSGRDEPNVAAGSVSSGNISGSGNSLNSPNGSVGGGVSTPKVQSNTKLAPYSFFEFSRLYPSFDAVAANGLKYGAFLEIRQDNAAPPGGGASSSPSGIGRARAQLYFRRETTYMGTDQLGYIRVGATDQPTSLMLTGNFENFDDGGWNGDPAIITGNAEVTWPYEDVGNLYTTSKIVYMSPQFFNMIDFGVSFEPSTANLGEDNTPGNCPYAVTSNNGVLGPMISNNALGCDATSSTSVVSETQRRRNTFDGVVRLRTAAGPVGIAATVGTIQSGKVAYNGTAAPGSVVKYQGLSILDLGLQLTYGGLAVGGHMFYGHTVGQWSNLEPAGGREAFAPLIGASYTMGSNVVGFHFFDYESAGSWTRLTPAMVGRTLSEEGLAIGDTFTVAPGAYLMLSYLYGTRHQTGVDLLSGTVGARTNNNTRAQGIWAGTMFRW